MDEAGNLFVAGRIKDLIIVDGRNHYPQDLELSIEKSHPLLRPGCTAVFGTTVDGQERVVAVAEIAKTVGAVNSEPLNPAAIVAAMRKVVAEQHDLRLYDTVLLKAGSVPKTSSGKIQRRATRAAYETNTLEGRV